MRAAWGLQVAGMIAVAVGGCSFVLVDRSTTPRPNGTLGCTSDHHSVLGDVVIAGAAGAVVTLLATDGCHTESCAIDDAIFGGGAIAIGSIAVISALYGVYEVGECRDAIAARHARGEDAPMHAARLQAWQLILDASTEARRGDCARVEEREPQVRALDAEMLAVFRRDAAIARCLQKAQFAPTTISPADAEVPPNPAR